MEPELVIHHRIHYCYKHHQSFGYSTECKFDCCRPEEKEASEHL